MKWLVCFRYYLKIDVVKAFKNGRYFLNVKILAGNHFCLFLLLETCYLYAYYVLSLSSSLHAHLYLLHKYWTYKNLYLLHKYWTYKVNDCRYWITLKTVALTRLLHLARTYKN